MCFHDNRVLLSQLSVVMVIILSSVKCFVRAINDYHGTVKKTVLSNFLNFTDDS